MRKRRFWGYATLTLSVALMAIGFGTGTALAIDSSSPNYQMTEWDFNSGATMDSCSGSYCAQASIGSDVGGSFSNPEFGEVITDEPMLEVIIVPGESDLGVLSTERTASKTTIVKIRNSYEGGYSLQMIGETPKFDGHALAAMTTAGASVMGTEQFGINLTANTTPSVGTLPRQVARAEGEQIIYGEPTADYRVANQFKYVNGDVIAQNVTEFGQTEYTISMIINVSNLTPAGHYSGDFALFVVPQL